MSTSDIRKRIKREKFAKALVEANGSATKAYLKLHPNVTYDSARTLGSEYLQKLHTNDVHEICERVGCTRDVVIKGIWERIQNSPNNGDYVKLVDLLGKFTGLHFKEREVFSKDNLELELLEVIKVRLKRKDKAEAKTQAIDVESTHTNEANIT